MSDRSDRRYGAVAFLVFFTTTAGTRIVSSDLGLIAAHRLALIRGRLAAAAGRTRLGAAARFNCTAGLFLWLRLRLLRGAILAHHLDVEQLLADVAADAAHHLAEDHEAFLLVLLLRILLAVAAQADALAQRLHRLEVIDPALVDLLQVEAALVEQQPG